MQLAPQRIAPCLSFDTEAEEAAKFYCAVFDNSRITSVSRYGEEGHDKRRSLPPHGAQSG